MSRGPLTPPFDGPAPCRVCLQTFLLLGMMMVVVNNFVDHGFHDDSRKCYEPLQSPQSMIAKRQPQKQPKQCESKKLPLMCSGCGFCPLPLSSPSQKIWSQYRAQLPRTFRLKFTPPFSNSFSQPPGLLSFSRVGESYVENVK